MAGPPQIVLSWGIANPYPFILNDVPASEVVE